MEIVIVGAIIMFVLVYNNTIDKDKKFIMLNMHSNIAKRDKLHRDTY